MFTHEVPDKETRLRHLKWSLQALAVAPSEQLALFPDSVAQLDKLVLEFETCAAFVLEHDGDWLSKDQIGALTATEHQLATMSRLAADLDADIWSDAGDEQWTQTRRLAHESLRAFGWSADPTIPD